MNESPDIEIYYAEICGLCHKAMDFFRSRNLPFTRHEVFWDAEKDAFHDTQTARDMFERIGGETDFVPQIFINGTHVAGWKKLEPMIENGDVDRLLEKRP